MSKKFQTIHFEEGIITMIGGKNKKRPWPKLTTRGGLTTHGKQWATEVRGKMRPVHPRLLILKRNQPCPCGSGCKFKKCCLGKEQYNGDDG
jgi:hypothetical protein